MPASTRFTPRSCRDEVILVVSRMVERKGVQYLIESLEGWDGHPEVKIVGDGPYLETLKALAREKNVNVDFLGFVDNSQYAQAAAMSLMLIFIVLVALGVIQLIVNRIGRGTRTISVVG